MRNWKRLYRVSLYVSSCDNYTLPITNYELTYTLGTLGATAVSSS